MTNGRNVASITAVIACALAAPLAIGSYSAQADELSDLRANQQLLQQRLDQLAQIPAPAGAYPGGPPAPTAGAGIVGGSFPRSFLVPGTDTSIRVGGTIAETADYFFSGGNPNQGMPVEHHGRRQRPGAGDPAQHPRAGPGGAAPRTATGPRQQHLRAEPARIEDQFRKPHPDRLGRGAHLYGIRLGRLEPVRAGRQQPDLGVG